MMDLAPEMIAAMRDARRNVANARMWAFEDECFRLGEVARSHPTDRVVLLDFLIDVATANGLIIVHGSGLIELMAVAGLKAGL